MKKKTVLFVCYGGGHSAMVAPVVRSLQKLNSELDIKVLGLTTAIRTFKNFNIPCLGYKDFIDESTDAQALKIGQMLADENHSVHTEIPREESVAYLGLNYADLIKTHGEVEAQKIYNEKKRMAFLPMHFMRRVFDKINPDFVVTTNSPKSEMAARRVAQERNINSMAITDLLGSAEGIWEMHVDHLCVAGLMAKKNHQVSSKVHAKKFHLVGNPAMDRAVEFVDKPKDLNWRNENFPPVNSQNKYVVLAEQIGCLDKRGVNLVRFKPEEIVQNLDLLYAACKKK